ncbi:Fic family protein [Streptomyces sp. NPDC059637]|uniref:Fic family protein n=1 Tax=Streptomyces sp. NPDC059637 TaxID=3347752 RepID=UPI0036A27FE2
MLYRTPELDSRDLSVLGEIEEMRTYLWHHLATKLRWDRPLRRHMAARAVAGSNTIEGYAATVDDVEAIMAGEQPLEAGDEVRDEVAGYQQALTYIQCLSDAPDFRYDAGLVNGLHFMMQHKHLTKRPGRWRNREVWINAPGRPDVRDYTAPDALEVPALMDEFITWLNEGDLDAPVHVRASMAHLNLVKIHPWHDGNGRMSRAVSTLVFAREALMPPEFSSIEEWLGYPNNTYAYYDVLKQVGGPVWSPERDTHPWIRFCLRAHHEQAQYARRLVDLQAAAWTTLEEAVAGEGRDERVLFALLPAFLGHRVRRALYQDDAELSEQAATRDIRLLCAADWLEQRGRARGTYYVAGPKTVSLRTRVTQDMGPLTDPYAD